LNEGFILLGWVADWPLAAWDGAGVPTWAKLIVGLGVLLFLLPIGIPGRWLGTVFLLPILVVRAVEPEYGELRFTLLDVGQGLAAVIQTSHHTLVYDAGPRFSESFDAGSAVVAPFLKQQGVTSIDRLILSNGDNDHAGGSEALAELLPVGMVQSGEPGRIRWTRALPCVAPEHWNWDGVNFHILYPSSTAKLEGNNASCVLLVENGGTRILLTGDIEKGGEALLLEANGDQLRADLVLIPHHGSKTSSTISLVKAVKPNFALASTGYRNRYGFPRPKVVERWLGEGAEVLNTAATGAIQFRVDANGRVLGPELYRLANPRYWQAR
jgi:competence protein ComEC